MIRHFSQAPLINHATSYRPLGLLLLFGAIASTPLSQVFAKDNSLPLNLEQSIEIAMGITPEMKVAEAQMGAQQGKLERIRAWPNPTLGMQGDNTLGIEDASGGYNVTELSFSQPIPLWRMKYEREQASLGIPKAQAQYEQQHLQLEHQVAQLFYAVQHKAAMLKLAKQRLYEVQQHQQKHHANKKNDYMVRYITPLEKMRLDIVFQTAKQGVAVAEGQYDEAALSFKALLNLPLDQPLKLPALKPATAPFSQQVLETHLLQHPNLRAGQYAVEEAEAGIAVAKANRIGDPVVTLFRRTDYLAGSRQAVNGIALSIDVPFWNTSNSASVEAGYLTQQAQAELDKQQRDLQANLHKSYLHYGHLREQASHYKNNVLKPAKKMLDLTHRGFDVGELSVLTLVDAYNTYFDAQTSYASLLAQTWQELAILRLSAGVSVVQATKISPNLEKTL